MATVIFKRKKQDVLGDIVSSLGLMGLTGNPSLTESREIGNPVWTLELPGVTLTTSQRLNLEEIAKRQGWGEGDPPPVAEESSLLEGLTELIVNEVSTLLATRGLSVVNASERASFKGALKQLASRGRIS